MADSDDSDGGEEGRQGSKHAPKKDKKEKEDKKEKGFSMAQVACMLTVTKRGVHGLANPRPKSKHRTRTAANASDSTPLQNWNLVHDELKKIRTVRAKEQLKEFQVYKQLKPAVQEQLLECVKYAKLDNGTPLFMQNSVPGVDDPGECYFILSGEVSVWVSSEEEREEAKGVGRRDSDPQVWLGKCVATVYSGTLLGQVALMNGQPRNATCLCDGDLELLYIRKSDFMRVLRDSMENILDSKGQFLEKHVPGLRKLTDVKSEHVLHNFHRRIFKRGHTFLQESVTPTETALYVIHKGTVEVRAKGFLVGALIPGALFGTSPAHNLAEEFTYVAARASVEAYEVHGRDVQKLPLSLRQDIFKHVSSLRLWHRRRLKEAGSTGPAGKKPGYQGLLSPLSMSELHSSFVGQRPESSPGLSRSMPGSPTSLGSSTLLSPLSGTNSLAASPSMLSSGGLTKPSTAPGGSRSHFMKLELARAELVAPSEPEQCRSKALKSLAAKQSQAQMDVLMSPELRGDGRVRDGSADSFDTTLKHSGSPIGITPWNPEASTSASGGLSMMMTYSVSDRSDAGGRGPHQSQRLEPKVSWERGHSDHSLRDSGAHTSKAQQLRRHRAKMSSLLAQQPVGPIFRTEKAKSQIAKAREVLVRLRRMP
mmetsp:Transcript_18352/g.42867  ORF Transcript_18352/g.42867 Transcript_18352/m.42867 type:complete len:650 (+) Transcript_18352:136-2085(+)